MRDLVIPYYEALGLIIRGEEADALNKLISYVRLNNGEDRELNELLLEMAELTLKKAQEGRRGIEKFAITTLNTDHGLQELLVNIEAIKSELEANKPVQP